MLTQWYVKIMGAERGPVTTDELRSLAASGELAVDDLVRSAADPTWVRADSVPEIFGGASLASASGLAGGDDIRATGDVRSDDGAWCSLELQSTDTKASIRWTTPGEATVVSATSPRVHQPLVRVPRRSLKIGHGATPAGRAEKQVQQTTVANRLPAESDTVVSKQVSAASEPDPDGSAEHRV